MGSKIFTCFFFMFIGALSKYTCPLSIISYSGAYLICHWVRGRATPWTGCMAITRLTGIKERNEAFFYTLIHTYG